MSQVQAVSRKHTELSAQRPRDIKSQRGLCETGSNYPFFCEMEKRQDIGRLNLNTRKPHGVFLNPRCGFSKYRDTALRLSRTQASFPSIK